MQRLQVTVRPYMPACTADCLAAGLCSCGGGLLLSHPSTAETSVALILKREPPAGGSDRPVRHCGVGATRFTPQGMVVRLGRSGFPLLRLNRCDAVLHYRTRGVWK